MNKPEPVAEVCSGWTLRWIGAEPIAHLLARHPGVRIGTLLYEEDAINAQLLGALREVSQMLKEWHDDMPQHVGSKEPAALAKAFAAIRAAEGEKA